MLMLRAIRMRKIKLDHDSSTSAFFNSILIDLNVPHDWDYINNTGKVRSSGLLLPGKIMDLPW